MYYANTSLLKNSNDAFSRFLGMKIRVSVIIAVYNGERFIKQCIESLLNQSYMGYEIIVVDDGSTDTTCDIIKNINHDRLKVIHLDSNRGCSAARNLGAMEARGEYLAILDADDFALPERLEKQIRFLEMNPDHAMVGTWINLENENGSSQIVKNPMTDPEIRRIMSWCCPIANTALMIRTGVFREVGGFPEEFRHGEDYRLFAKVLRKYKAANLNDVLVVKRDRKDGLTFKLPAWKHAYYGLRHRIYSIETVQLPKYHYIYSIIASLGILLVRSFGLNRTALKKMD